MPVDFATLSIVNIAIGIASFLVCSLILWLIIFTAVRAALRSHQADVDEEAAARASRAARREAAQHGQVGWRG